jgi:hypothetical protein
MTDLEFIAGRIPGYADYGNVDARHQVDKQIRAWLGEALSDARARLEPEASLGERLDGLILRCEFSDQRVIRAADHAQFDEDLVARIHQLDRTIVACAEAIRAITSADELGAALDDVARALDERFGAIADAPSI